MAEKVRVLLIIVLFTLFFSSCGGGGGGGSSFVGAALVSLSVSPRSIDVGDRTKVETEVREVNEDGIILKFRYPVALSYVLDSAFLIVDNNKINISPLFNEDDGTNSFLVFFLSRSLFSENGEGRVEFLLEGVDRVTSGTIGVDADVDDPLVNNLSEFSIDDPQFQAEAEADIDVIS
ncbi:MAG: hypothetical protein D6780_03275 [Candidatus Dadabacteria bacterium]|nr:MAG: hypothetical protein D6780_03275 [Candidatus Dadabacteria bacterium]